MANPAPDVAGFNPADDHAVIKAAGGTENAGGGASGADDPRRSMGLQCRPFDRRKAGILLVRQRGVKIIKRRLHGSHRFQHRREPPLLDLHAAGRAGGVVLGTNGRMSNINILASVNLRRTTQINIDQIEKASACDRAFRKRRPKD
jgi:hypothetical protein